MRGKKKTMKKRLEPHGGELFALVLCGAVGALILIVLIGLSVAGTLNAWWWLYLFPVACLFWYRWWLWVQDWIERLFNGEDR